MGPERVDPPRRKPWRHGCTRGGDQGPTFRFEPRAGEFTSTASLRALKPVGGGKPTGPQPGREARRGTGSERARSRGGDNQKPGDLALGRAKPGESPVEARRDVDVQFAPLTWG